MMDAPNLEQLMNLDQGAYVETINIDKGRQEVLKEAACSLGARGGLSKRTKEIVESLEKNSEKLNKVYSFQSVMLPYGVAPPVITEQTRNSKIEDGNNISYAGVTYRIEEPAKFLLAPPTWRQYVYKGLENIELDLPAKGLLPKNEEERAFWKDQVGRCWGMGVEQAELILENNINHLQRDFVGMLRYKLLALKGEVSMPRVSTKYKERDVRDGGNELRLDQRDYEIKAPSKFGE